MHFNQKFFNETANSISQLLPKDLKTIPNNIQQNIKSILKSGFEQLDLVTREEFDIQQQILLKTRQKLENLEQQLNELLKKNQENDDFQCL